MSGDLYYARRNLYKAAFTLATGAGDVRSRLYGAFQDIQHIIPDDLPEGLRNDLIWIKNELTKRKPVFDEGYVKATLHRMRNKTGVKIAKKIFDLFCKLDGYLDEQHVRNN